MKKDDFLWDLVMQPPKQRIPIEPFDLSNEKMKEGFNVSSEGLKGVSFVIFWTFVSLPVLSFFACVVVFYSRPASHAGLFLSPPLFSHLTSLSLRFSDVLPSRCVTPAHPPSVLHPSIPYFFHVHTSPSASPSSSLSSSISSASPIHNANNSPLTQTVEHPPPRLRILPSPRRQEKEERGEEARKGAGLTHPLYGFVVTAVHSDTITTTASAITNTTGEITITARIVVDSTACTDATGRSITRRDTETFVVVTDACTVCYVIFGPPTARTTTTASGRTISTVVAIATSADADAVDGSSGTGTTGR